DGSVYLEVSGLQFQPGDEGIAFPVSGGADSDLFSVLLKDRDGRQFVSYVPLDRKEKTVFLRFADFLALPPESAENAEFCWAERAVKQFLPDVRPVPEKICGISMGLSLRHLWWDKGGSCRIGTVSRWRSAAPDSRRSGYAGRFAVPYNTIGVALPPDVFDPMDGCRRINGGRLMTAAGSPCGEGGRNTVAVRWFDAQMPYRKIHGREAKDRALIPAVREWAERHVPLLADDQGRAAAMLILPADTQNPNGAVALFGIPEAAYLQEPELMRLAAKTAQYLLDVPQMRSVFPCLREEKPALKVRLHHPGKTVVRGELSVQLAGLPGRVVSVVLPPQKPREITVILPEIPEDFKYTGLDWKVSLQTPAGEDVWQDRADAAVTAAFLAEHLLQLAETHGDGRFSHHFFADIYGARALAVLGGRQGRADWIRAARKMVHGIVSRQTPEGALPMGYGEQRRISWVADNGTAVLGILDFAARFPEVRGAYLAAAKRYYLWRETFYMDDARVAKLEKEFGKDPAHIRKGFYGIGYNDGPFYGKGSKFKEVQRVERGSLWVNGISMASLPLYWQLTGDARILAIARRNLQEYLAENPDLNFFSAEALVQMYRRMPDAGCKKLAETALKTNFIPGLFAGKKDYALLEQGGRRTMDTLAALYCLNDGLERSPRLRAYLVRNIWFACSPSLPWSVHRTGGYFDHSSHGSSVAAARYAGAMTLIWLAELLYPGSTLSGTGGD
ncbi:MAG: hypothetical protein J6S73_00615, partial [Lentisphaeria bacterium]|nr:hypothetical protein [Lentisphaeria bacterium]